MKKAIEREEKLERARIAREERAERAREAREELEEMIAEMIPLIAQHKADGAMSTAETCEKIKQVYENELHYVLTGEKITMPFEEWYDG